MCVEKEVHVSLIRSSKSTLYMWEGRVLKALYTPYNKSLESNVTSHLAHVTKPGAS